MSLYVGLMSGTSMDGIDAVLADVAERSCRVVAALHHDYPAPLLASLQSAVADPSAVTLPEYGALDVQVGRAFAHAAAALLKDAHVARDRVRAIGSHGQTLLHAPSGPAPFTLQIGDPNVIAEHLGIDVVADFRRRDIAAGGEGAPLVPAFHAAMFASPGEGSAVVNLGGIGNVTLLEPDGGVRGFDTGPGNGLMDAWMRKHRNEPFDRDGAWAAQGRVADVLLAKLLEEPFLARKPPKSTGRELFNLAWLEARVAAHGAGLSPECVQATLAELTARSVTDGIIGSHGLGAVKRVVLCGGGVHNRHVVERLRTLLHPATVMSSADLGLDPLHVEAAAFAWLAARALAGAAGNLPSVTGARERVVLGAIYRGTVTSL